MGWSIESGPHTFSPKATDEYIDIAYMIRYDPGDGGTFKFLSRQKNDSTGFTRALEMAERIAKAEGMTVDELLLKLDTEYDKLKSELPKAYEDYGRAVYPKIRDTVGGVYSGDMVYERDQIKARETRMDYIKVLQSQIRIEKGRLKA